eukprot:2178220-Prymnesium_polylepis.1
MLGVADAIAARPVTARSAAPAERRQAAVRPHSARPRAVAGMRGRHRKVPPSQERGAQGAFPTPAELGGVMQGPQPTLFVAARGGDASAVELLRLHEHAGSGRPQPQRPRTAQAPLHLPPAGCAGAVCSRQPASSAPSSRPASASLGLAFTCTEPFVAKWAHSGLPFRGERPVQVRGALDYYR